MLVALSKRLPLPLGPLEAEAKAIDETASFAMDIGLQEAIFETDYAVLARALSDTTQMPITIENIIASIHLKLQTFRQYQVVIGGATLESGCSQEHPDLKKNIYIIIKKNLFAYPLKKKNL